MGNLAGARYWFATFPSAEGMFWVTAGGGYFLRTLFQLHQQQQRATVLALEKSQLQSSLNQAQLETLRSRLNPHFLFNSLQNISVLTKHDPQTASRMLHEEVTFNETAVTSLDWATYPILRFTEAPKVTPVIVQRINEESLGAGEEVMAAAAAAIANAFFDATGKRMNQFPLTPQRVLAALA